ncbi:bifunctional 4-hydroxy-2-oxoglutarate aldolase/2-dehydro-3-deoxy-phosphogluconate aldolase [Pseudonocardia nigra]|uniref:bifunctional 4-hydroxy-2-oxoglutarate aldolase/2-dehydro-3-deoxy-phosphogluconate aldolase n=1 Tax=Pseudonocardia nigra TaxID=1921578 RepID=UPI001C5DEE0E|nr:bifunctional 4-hydroxy-2-oxoglutarate aldolase/2-dehydro-3-deoxy-phosphogluconate aldolase [Pseudonocardia nigra]
MASVARFFDETFAQQRVMAILRGFSVERTVELAQRAWDNGIHAVEVPIQSAEAIDALAAAVRAGAARGLPVGAGTVVTLEHVAQAADAGAAFTVAPGFDERVAAASAAAGLAHLPGVASASEVQRALGLGLTWMKAFPAAVLGAGWFSAMRGPFPQVRFVATGGMGAANAREFLDAGASVVAVGSALEDPEQLDRLAAAV